MFSDSIIASDRQAGEVARTIHDIKAAQSSEQVLRSIVDGLPHEVIAGVSRSLEYERKELQAALDAYQSAKAGAPEQIMHRAADDPGALLIATRIARGWSQKDLARKLGLREQAIQRYEAERYRSISLGNYLRVARTLSVELSPKIRKGSHEWLSAGFEIPPKEMQKVLKHARSHGWLNEGDKSDEKAINQLVRYVTEHVESFGTPSLLRTGLNVAEHTEDWPLLSWKAQVTRRAMEIIRNNKVTYRPLDVSWLIELVRLSREKDGPLRAQKLLLQHGIVLIAERNVPGMHVDGAAFLVGNVPVIGLTLLRDSLDNFWFTLLHEIGHVILHYRTGLASGFFDDVENSDVDEMEDEANRFASNMLIPEDIWTCSPARIARTAGPVEQLADQLKISPAIIFGRIRMERKNYTIFSGKIGRGVVRKQLLTLSEDR